MFELGRHETKVLFFIGLMAAGAGGVAAFTFWPGFFSPWPLALGLFFLAGIGGALSFWATEGRLTGLALGLFFLFPLRVILFWRYSPARIWPLAYQRLLTGDGFPGWAGLAVLIILYAGWLTAPWVRITRAIFSSSRSKGTEVFANTSTALAELQGVFFGTLLLAGLLGAFNRQGPGSRGVMFCLWLYFLAGIFFLGWIRAQGLVASWQAEGTLAAEKCVEDWWRGHRGWIWAGLFLLLFLPTDFRALSLGRLWPWLRFLFFRPNKPPSLPSPGTSGEIISLPKDLEILQIFLLFGLALTYLITFAVTMVVLGGLLFLFGRGLGRFLKRWAAALGPFFRGIYRFFLGLWSLFREMVTVKIPAILPPLGRSVTGRWGRTRRRQLYPPTPVRRLFARLILWGREQGIALPPTLAPMELVFRMAARLPDREEDLLYLAEIYRGERYGGRSPDHHGYVLYRQAWQRVIHPCGREEGRTRQTNRPEVEP